MNWPWSVYGLRNVLNEILIVWLSFCVNVQWRVNMFSGQIQYKFLLVICMKTASFHLCIPGIQHNIRSDLFNSDFLLFEIPKQFSTFNDTHKNEEKSRCVDLTCFSYCFLLRETTKNILFWYVNQSPYYCNKSFLGNRTIVFLKPISFVWNINLFPSLWYSFFVICLFKPRRWISSFFLSLHRIFQKPQPIHLW